MQSSSRGSLQPKMPVGIPSTTSSRQTEPSTGQSSSVTQLSVHVAWTQSKPSGHSELRAQVASSGSWQPPLLWPGSMRQRSPAPQSRERTQMRRQTPMAQPRGEAQSELMAQPSARSASGRSAQLIMNVSATSATKPLLMESMSPSPAFQPCRLCRRCRTDRPCCSPRTTRHHFRNARRCAPLLHRRRRRPTEGS